MSVSMIFDHVKIQEYERKVLEDSTTLNKAFTGAKLSKIFKIGKSGISIDIETQEYIMNNF